MVPKKSPFTSPILGKRNFRTIQPATIIPPSPAMTSMIFCCLAVTLGDPALHKDEFLAISF